jgi:hypothetical protein
MTRCVVRLFLGLIAGGLVACGPEVPSGSSAIAQSSAAIRITPGCSKTVGDTACRGKLEGAVCTDIVGKPGTCALIPGGLAGWCWCGTWPKDGDEIGDNIGDEITEIPLIEIHVLNDLCATPDVCKDKAPGAACGSGGEICRGYTVKNETATTRFWDCKCEVPPKPVPTKK